jgi:hypothetical protein
MDLKQVFLVGLYIAATLASPAFADVTGEYMEARTCQVYTGPCFANGEVGLAGKEAVMAWRIREGQFAGVELSGLSIVAVLRAPETLGMQGIEGTSDLRTLVMIDHRADSRQREALVEFLRAQVPGIVENAERIVPTSIHMDLDTEQLDGYLQAGESVRLVTRRARAGDCICSNETGYYPPLAPLESYVPGVTTEGQVTARPLGTTWSIPQSRTAYMGTFALDRHRPRVAG